MYLPFIAFLQGRSFPGPLYISPFAIVTAVYVVFYLVIFSCFIQRHISSFIVALKDI